jgi:hypothetical protein
MDVAEDLRAAEIARAFRVKRTNAAVAAVTGTLFAATAAWIYPETRSSQHIVLGIFAGLVYANAFEYVLHRFLLHVGDGFLVQRHKLHHDSAGTPQEARYVNFATSPWVVVLVIVLNSPVPFALEAWLHAGLAAGMLVAFTAYYIAYEEIHWRIHLGGWLPGWLRLARRHHFLHHGGFKGRYNVFLPVFDWLLERREWRRNIPFPSSHS